LIASLFSIKNFNKQVQISGLSGVMIFPIKLMIDSAPTALFHDSIASKFTDHTSLSLSARF